MLRLSLLFFFLGDLTAGDLGTFPGDFSGESSILWDTILPRKLPWGLCGEVAMPTRLGNGACDSACV